jgi:hypothetical protein
MTTVDQQSLPPNFLITLEGDIQWLTHQPTGNRVILGRDTPTDEVLRTKLRYLNRQLIKRRRT